MIQKKLGPYTITEEIGAGGMATVYRAYQPSGAALDLDQGLGGLLWEPKEIASTTS
jgi:hypothetical protein